QIYYSLQARDAEYELVPLTLDQGLGILVWSPLAGGFLSGKYQGSSPPPEGTRFAEAGRFVPFDADYGWRVVEAQRKVAARLGVSPARVALAWLLGRPAITSVIAAARSLEHLEDNLAASDLDLSDEDRRELEHASNPGIPYPKWMVLQHDVAEDPRLRTLHPELFTNGGTWEDLRGKAWRG
ncbi:MAG TPA: aldo/keto reductase, partial [Rectinemataceae bacterium]|nr:aldo/keto reductase [Rectinemataceae bacterium]